MINVSIKQLLSAIAEADAFKLPEMNEGTAYLYDTIYSRLSRNLDVRLSEIDFDSFDTDDLDSLGSLYSDVFERNSYAADGIMSTLRHVTPMCKAVSYV